MNEAEAQRFGETMKKDQALASKGYVWSVIDGLIAQMVAASTADLRKALDLRDERLRQQASRIAKLERALNAREGSNYE